MDFQTMEESMYGKRGGCRYAGPRCYLDDLRNVESIILKWLDKQKEEENVVKNG